MGSLQLKHSFSSIVTQHTKLFPKLEVDDLYKLVFQAAMGSEHAATDPDLIIERLISEVNELIPTPNIPLIMPISPDHRLVRVGLSPYSAMSGNIGALGCAFVETSITFKPSIHRLDTYWSWVEELANNGKLPFSHPALKDYIDKRRRQGYPAVHHSTQYRRRYHPAYRVVLKDLMDLPMECDPLSTPAARQ